MLVKYAAVNSYNAKSTTWQHVAIAHWSCTIRFLCEGVEKKALFRPKPFRFNHGPLQSCTCWCFFLQLGTLFLLEYL